jgi:hypothetical protein
MRNPSALGFKTDEITRVIGNDDGSWIAPEQ